MNCNVTKDFMIKKRNIYFYDFAEGELEVLKNGVVVGSMGPGRAFGELAVLYGCTRTASIRG